MAPKTTQKSSSNKTATKQSTLRYSAVKPGNNKKSKGLRKFVSEPVTAIRSDVDLPVDSEIESFDDEITRPKTEARLFRSRDGLENSVNNSAAQTQEFDSSLALSVHLKSKRWNKYHTAVKDARMGGLEAIHDDGRNGVLDILRTFDSDYAYGPCDGITRMARWQRASALGLEPPIEVFEILSTKEAEEDELAYSVFHNAI